MSLHRIETLQKLPSSLLILLVIMDKSDTVLDLENKVGEDVVVYNLSQCWVAHMSVWAGAFS